MSLLAVPLAACLVWGDASGAPRSSAKTVDPEPPVALSVELITLQKNATGGVASLRLTVSARTSLSGVVVTARVPGNLVFADGSRLKQWDVELDEAGTGSLQTDVIVPEDGKFVVSAEVTGSSRGRSVRRGAAYKLLVGAEEPAPKFRGRAIEYEASQDGGA